MCYSKGAYFSERYNSTYLPVIYRYDISIEEDGTLNHVTTGTLHREDCDCTGPRLMLMALLHTPTEHLLMPPAA